MLQKICNHAAMLVLGLFVGAVVVAAWQGVRQETPVQATATHGEGNFAIATGFIDERLEAFFFLDFLTGDLRAAAVSRQNGDFVAFFEHNIAQDFGTVGKNPKYLMVTGQADLPRGSSRLQVGQSIVYIAEAASGNVAAYALFWNETLNKKGQKQRGEFKLLSSGSFRTTFVRDE